MTPQEEPVKKRREKRKHDPIEICASEDVGQSYMYWDDVKFLHNPLPEVDFEEIDTSTTIFGRKLKAPIVISAITGGYGKAEERKRNLGSVAGQFGLGMCVGSQRAALENPEVARSHSSTREF